MVGKFMNTTKILGDAVGIQRQDIIDRTEEQTADGLTGAVILGRFKRGRVDAPMEIHQGNIRGELGYDPKNPDYIAVQDCLDTDVPSVQVLRVKGVNQPLICNSIDDTNQNRTFTVNPDLPINLLDPAFNAAVDTLIESGVFSFNGLEYRLSDGLYNENMGIITLSTKMPQMGEFSEIKFCASIPFIFQSEPT